MVVMTTTSNIDIIFLNIPCKVKEHRQTSYSMPDSSSPLKEKR